MQDDRLRNEKHKIGNLEESLLSLQKLLRRKIVVSLVIDEFGRIDFLACHDGSRYLGLAEDDESEIPDVPLNKVMEGNRLSETYQGHGYIR